MRVLVWNPASGDRRTGQRAATLARERGYDVRQSTTRGEALALARTAAGEPAVESVVACGGDGTLNEVVRGVDEAGALDSVTVGVAPAGTGNDFADNVGIDSVETAFAALDRPARRLDLGTAIDPVRPFLNSCVAGLTAEASANTPPDRKRRLGVVAYVLQTLAESRRFTGHELAVRAGPREDPLWRGRALLVLVGNGRRFPGEARRPADVEDGKLNVVIVEHAPVIDYLAQGAADRFLRRGASHLTRVHTDQLRVESAVPVSFSLDGEFIQSSALSVRCRPGAMRFHVGPDYRPHRATAESKSP